MDWDFCRSRRRGRGSIFADEECSCAREPLVRDVKAAASDNRGNASDRPTGMECHGPLPLSLWTAASDRVCYLSVRHKTPLPILFGGRRRSDASVKKRALLRQLVQNEEKGDSSSRAGCVARTLVSLHEAGGREGELSESSTGQEGFPKHDLRCLLAAPCLWKGNRRPMRIYLQ